MKHLLFISLFLFSTSVFAEIYSPSPSSNYGSKSEQVDKLKQYITKGKELIGDFNRTLDKYEQTINKLKTHKSNCGFIDYNSSDRGTIFDASGVCKTDLEVLVSRMKDQATKLDAIEYELKNVKDNIQKAQQILVVIHSSTELNEDTMNLNSSISDSLDKRDDLEEIKQMN